MTRNRFGLSRDPPLSVKREVRQACGFGCVICGSVVTQYEHIDPEFKDARAHEPGAIALLCPTCHEKVTKGLISKSDVKRFRLAPVSLGRGYAIGRDYFLPTIPDVVIGGLTVKRTRTVLVIDDDELIRVDKPLDDGGPFRMSLALYGADGKPTLEIDENEVKTFPTSWDIEAKGRVLTFRGAPRKISMELELSPNGIGIRRMDLVSRGYRVLAGPNLRMRAECPNGSVFECRDAVVRDCEAALVVTGEGIELGLGCSDLVL